MHARNALCLLALLALAPSSLADVVHLRGGGQLVGRATVKGDEVLVEFEGGSMTFPRAKVVRIERTELPVDVVARRRESLENGDAAGAHELAGYARSNGLVAEEGRMLDLAAGWAPDNADVARALRDWKIHRRVLPPDPESEVALRAVIGEGAHIYGTQHFVIVHDVTTAKARGRGEMLELAWKKFHALADEMGLRVPPLDARLEVVYFADFDRWLDAVGLPAEQARQMSGLFMSSTGRVLIYDTMTSPPARDARKKADDELAALGRAGEAIEKQRSELDKLELSLDRLGNSREEQRRREELEAWIVESREVMHKQALELEHRQKQVALYTEQLRRYLARENLATTTHEACHQLSFATGISHPLQPRWLMEGLATLFEVSSRASFVLEAPNAGRLRDLRASHTNGRAARLAEVASDLVFDPDGPGAIVAYANAWALSHFLARKRPDEFARFVRDSTGARPGPEHAVEQLAEFRRFFGADLEALERDWLGYLRRL